MMTKSIPEIRNANTALIAFNGQQLSEFLREEFKIDILTKQDSAMINSNVFYAVGETASTISLYDSSLELLSNED